MDRRLLLAAFAVLLAGGVPPVHAADITIEAGAQGVNVQTAGLQGSAPRLSYDEAKGILVLEGTADVPVALVYRPGLLGTAPRLSYDTTKGILMLEGTRDVPAMLVRSRKGPDEEVRAAKIIYSLNEVTLQAESVGAIRGSKP